VKAVPGFDIPFAHVRNPIDPVRTTRLLLVDPDPVMRAVLADAVGPSARVDACSSFQSARSRLGSTVYDLVVTAARLEAYNGLHLVYLARHSHQQTRAIVYDGRLDVGSAGDVRRAGAFYEVGHKLAVTLPTYISVPLPDVDRRLPAVQDRRRHPRGGRRRWDRHVFDQAPHEETDGPTPTDR
jgi:PleD family two-component response regulator